MTLRIQSIAGCIFWVTSSAALGCSCMPVSQFSERLPDRSDLSIAVFTAEVVRFDPVADASSAPREGDGGNGRSSRRVNAVDPKPGVLFPDQNRCVVFRILESFSGPDAAPTEVWTESQSSACGFEFAVGKKYLVEAQYWPPNEPRWTVNSCSRTAALGTPASDENVRVLQLWKAGMRPASWIKGRMFGRDMHSQIAGVRLRLTDGKVTQYAQSGADGVFSFANLTPGVYTLTADIPGQRNQVTVDLREQWSAAPVIFVGFP